MITAEVAARSVQVNLPKFEKAVDKTSEASTLDTAYEVLRLSQFEVPHDEGTLQNSGTVETLPNGDVIIGYHSKYAARLHEHPEYHFQKGRKGKYLSDPIMRNADVLGLKFGRTVQRRLF